MAIVYRKSLNKRIIEIANFLADYGESVIKNAYRTHDFVDDTKNLKDSYGSAVYYNGKLIRGTIRTLGSPEAVESKDWYKRKVRGRRAVENFLRHEYTPPYQGFFIAVVAAMPYGEVIENKYKYKVISGARRQMKDMAEELSGKLGVRKNVFHIHSIDEEIF